MEHRDLETQLFTLKETEDALLFPSGFAANQVCSLHLIPSRSQPPLPPPHKRSLLYLAVKAEQTRQHKQ